MERVGDRLVAGLDVGERGALLHKAILTEAGLSRADLTGAWLDRADLTKANLSGANLSGADLGTARDLAQEQLDGAIGDSRTKLPASLRRPESWSESEGLQPG